MTSNQVLSEIEYNVVGKRPLRPDGVDNVTGRARYGADTNQTGTLQAKVLRSPYPHARIRSIDTSKAEAFPGVRAVVTAKDLAFASLSKEELGGEYTGLKFASDHVLASDKVLYKGHPVAAVAAVNAHVAESAPLPTCCGCQRPRSRSHQWRSGAASVARLPPTWMQSAHCFPRRPEYR